MSFDPISFTMMEKAFRSNSDKVAVLQQELDNLIPGFNYKGSVSKVADLPGSAERGDSYTVTNEGEALYVYNGTSFVKYNSDVITTAQINSLYQ